MTQQQRLEDNLLSPLTPLIGKGRIYDPFTISLHLTDLCNSRCRFCAGDSHQVKEDSVKTEKLIEFLEAHQGNKWNAVNIHGGEPTIRKDFLYILEKIRQFGYKKIILQTNAFKMADREFAAKVKTIGVDIFTIGFHGHTPALAEQATRVSKSFELALKGFHHIKEMGSFLRITTVVCKLNYRFIKEICHVAIENGVDHVNISAMQPAGSAESSLPDLMILYDEAYPFIKNAIDYTLAQGKIITLEGFPYCVVRGYEKYQVDWKTQQLKVLYQGMMIDNYNNFLNLSTRSKDGKCKQCALNFYCGGVYTNYISFYGWDEFKPYEV
ncbi:MAG: radical SAM protein [Acidobacteria bacterium]|jgi:MoaA/NifB/PqqE/SkfB family radical SAM enzyme|nr:radical SAM protein [Acidobacteriota bacterium]